MLQQQKDLLQVAILVSIRGILILRMNNKRIVIFSKHKCDNNGTDPFAFLYEQIGAKTMLLIPMSNRTISVFMYRGWSSSTS